MVLRQKRADSFVSHAKLFAVGSWKPFLERKPHLWQAICEHGRKELSFEEKCLKWDFLLMVAMAWWAINSAKIEIPEGEFPNIADTLERQLANWNPRSVSGFSDLNKFIKGYEPQYQNLVDLREVTDFTKVLVGTWVVWNLTNKAKLDDEAEVASLLGNLVYKSIAGYWNV